MREPVIGDLLDRAARSDRGVRFLSRAENDGLRLSYAELYERACGVAGALQALGVEPGDRVAIVLPTTPAFYDAFFGASLAGAIPVALYPPVRLGRLEEYHRRTAQMLRAAGARLVLTDRRVGRLLGESIDRARPELGWRAVESLDAEPFRPVDVSPDAIAFLQFSSGTTVEPKPVALTHRQVIANAQIILSAILDAHPEDPERPHSGVSWLPLYHDMGLIGGVFVALLHPGELVLIPPELFVARPAIWLQALSRWKGTISPAPNFAYALCVERIRDEELAGLDLSHWRVALDGAEPVTPGVLDRFVERFAAAGLRPEALTPVYGLAEAALAVTFSSLRERFRVTRFDREALIARGIGRLDDDGLPLVSLGPPLPGFELRIVDAAGHGLGPGRLGRVLVRGPSVMREYFGRPEDTARALRDGWLDTGDSGFLHQGELYLHGREKDLIVIRGRNHAPQDVEQAAQEVEGVRPGCVAAVGIVLDEADGESLFVFVERARDASATNAAIGDRVAEVVVDRTGLTPEQVIVLAPGTLPRTSSGKIRRAETRRRFVAAALDPPRRMTPLRIAAELIRSRLAMIRARRTH